MHSSDLLARPAGAKLDARDLEADLAICEAATPGPYRIWPCGCNFKSCNQMFISVTNSDGRLNPDDAKFYSEARAGWPHAIRRAIEAELKIEMLEKQLQTYQEQERGVRGPWD